jgi:hypothetical protein
MMMLPYLEMAEEAFAADKKQPWYQAAAAALDVSDAHVGLPPTPDQLMHHPQIAPDGLLRERVQQPLPPAPRTSLGKKPAPRPRTGDGGAGDAADSGG